MGGRANEIGLLAAIVLLYAFLAGFAPNFLTLPNQLNILRDAAFVGIIAWGMTLVLIAGEIDISVGPHVAFAGVVLATLAQAGLPLPLACLLVLILGALIGSVAGALRAYMDVPSFIVTLALWLALRWGLEQPAWALMTAFIVALVAIKTFLQLIKRISFIPFAIYRFIVAAAVYVVFF